jgi:hypothetical protein
MGIRMRITLDLDDALVHRAQQKAVRRGVTLSRVVEDALRASLAPASSALISRSFAAGDRQTSTSAPARPSMTGGRSAPTGSDPGNVRSRVLM